MTYILLSASQLLLAVFYGALAARGHTSVKAVAPVLVYSGLVLLPVLVWTVTQLKRQNTFRSRKVMDISIATKGLVLLASALWAFSNVLLVVIMMIDLTLSVAVFIKFL